MEIYELVTNTDQIPCTFLLHNKSECINIFEYLYIYMYMLDGTINTINPEDIG